MGAQGPESADEDLLDWMEKEMRFASRAILKCVSATGLTMRRDAFGQRVVPKAGSIVAAPATDLSGGDPDYFFHWLRDSALVMDALCILHLRGALPGALCIFDDFVAFSLGLNDLDGPSLLRQRNIRKAVRSDFLKYVRSKGDLMRVVGDAPLGEVRFNADGTLDIIRWHRPQNDGPALRALSLLRWRQFGAFGEPAAALVAGDLAFAERHWMEPCYDLWEEELGHHYYTGLVQMAALEDGAEWMAENGSPDRAGPLRSAGRALRERLDLHWSPERRCYLSRLEPYRDRTDKDLDASIILAVLHANRVDGPHSVLDPRVHATLERLEALFASEYLINATHRDGRGPAMGRYAGDRYVSGGAWYMTTLAAAEFHYRLAGRVARGHRIGCVRDNAPFLTRVLGDCPMDRGAPSAVVSRERLISAFLRRGDTFMATVRDHTPASGELSEQFDQSTGLQSSARNLAWSYAAFITAYETRRRLDAVRQ